MANNKIDWSSWGTIIVALILFWPIGVYLIVKRSKTDKQTALTAAKVLKVLGTVFIVIGIITLIAVVGIFYLILGIVLKVIAKKLTASAENVRKYLAIVVNGNVRQLDSIASAVGKPYDVVKKELQQLIDDGYFKNAYINEATREIVLAQPAVNVTPNVNANAGVEATTRIVSCPCCGANNTICGATGECEYCGSPLA